MPLSSINRIPYTFRRINVADYFGDCVEEVGLDLESKNIQLNYDDLVEPSTQIIADPEQLKRVNAYRCPPSPCWWPRYTRRDPL